jgi:hypothetical protein
MRTLAVLVALAGTATAGPVFRVGMVGGYDSSAPGHKEDGLALGAGYWWGPVTAELAYSYLDYNPANGIGGGANRLGGLLQARLASMDCHKGACPHFDLDLGAGWRWLEWQPGSMSSSTGNDALVGAPIDRSGREVTIGVSGTFGWHFALHYVAFKPDDTGPTIVCRGSCPMRVSGSDDAVLLEASFVIGGS